MITDFKRIFQKDGLKGLTRYTFGKLVNIERYKEEIDTLYYFLNQYYNVAEFPKANGSLRKIQQGDTILLAIFDEICQRNKLRWWLDAGTLLGAVRHQGFIPWDDDVDICMLRHDYERAIPILKTELAKYGIDAIEEENEPLARIGIGYLHKKTGLWIDLFPVECCKVDIRDEKLSQNLQKQAKKYRKIYNKYRISYSREKMLKVKKNLIGGFSTEKESISLLYAPELGMKPHIWLYNNIFPLSYRKFEEYNFPVPNDINTYLLSFYGKSYMNFPKSGVEHHGDERGALSTWAYKSGTDMDEVLNYLKGVLKKVKEKY